MSKPFLLVDVDGVLNALCAPHDTSAFEAVAQAGEAIGGPFTIRVPNGTADRLRELEEHFEMVWATTWVDNAFSEIGPLCRIEKKWPVIMFDKPPLSWPYQVPQNPGKYDYTWKLAQVSTWLGDHPAAWIDDDLGNDAYEWSKLRNSNGVKTMLCKTIHYSGMTESDVENLIFWAKGLLDG